MSEVWLVLAEQMPKPELDAGLLADALRERGVRVREVPWVGPGSPEPAEWAAADLTVLRTPWDYVATPDRFLGRLAEIARHTRLLNPADVVAWNAHKRYLTQFAAAGLPVPEVLVLPRGCPAAQRDAAVDQLRELGVADLVVKPAIGVGGHGAVRVGIDQVGALLEGELAGDLARTDLLLQRFDPRVLTEGEVSLILFGGEVSHAVRKSPATGEFRVHDHFGGRVEVVVPTAAQREVATAVLAAVPGDEVPVYARVDLLGAEAPALVELELIEPELFLRLVPGAAARFAAVLEAELERVPTGGRE